MPKKKIDDSVRGRFTFIASCLALDFCNTLEGRRSESPVDRLVSYRDLVDWTHAAEEIDRKTKLQLISLANSKPKLASATYRRAIRLRKSLFEVFLSVCEKRAVDSADLDRLNREYHSAIMSLRIKPSSSGFFMEWQDGCTLDKVIWPIAISAQQVLTDGRASKWKKCLSEDCMWFFVDLSRNNSKHWCQMTACGNRAKARSHRRRRKEISDETS